MNIDDLRGKRVFISHYPNMVSAYYAGLLKLKIVLDKKYSDISIEGYVFDKIVLKEFRMPFDEFCYKIDNDSIDFIDYLTIPSDVFTNMHKNDDLVYKRYYMNEAIRNNNLDEYSVYYINKFLKHYKLKRKNEFKHTN